MITIYGFRRVPAPVQGLVRDLRVRWALREAGLTYEAVLLAGGENLSERYRALQPFGQVPTFEEDGLVLFESGAIVLHIAARCETLLPADERGRARAITWLLAALNTVEVPVQQLAQIDLFCGAEEWAKLRRPAIESRVRQRLSELATRIGTREYLEDRFTAGDLMMTTVLRNLRHTHLVQEQPVLEAYQARCEARPAFRRALEEQMAAFES